MVGWSDKIELGRFGRMENANWVILGFESPGETNNVIFMRSFSYWPKTLVREFPFLQSSARVGSTMHCLGLHAECISKETRKLPKISFDQTIAEVAERLFKSRPPGIEMSDLS